MASAFVGRADESRQLDASLAMAARHSPTTVMLDGEAGVGKSRLLREFTGRAVAAGACVLAGGCIELGGGTVPYGPLIEALRLFHRQMGDEQARELAGPSWSELAGFISHFTGVEPSTDTLGSQIHVFGLVFQLLDHVGGRAPAVLVLEDLHWADPSTLDLVAYLNRMKSDQRMMLVCSYRSGLPPDHPLRKLLAEPEFTRRVQPISLARFTPNELWTFVNALGAEPVGSERMERYFELSEGNAYFAEQLVAADDPAAPTPQVPETLNEIMRVRLALLSGAATNVVRVAAVAGRRVSDSLLAAVIDLDAVVLDEALRECLDRRIFVEDRTGEAYAFEHALLRETAYQSVSPRTRRWLHAAMAEALTSQVDTYPELLPELAFHWFAAGHQPEALASSVRAGALAVRMRAFQEAETQFRRALELWSRVPDAELVAGTTRERLLGVAADAARWAGHVPQAVDWAKQAIDEVAADADPWRAGELYERLGSYLWESGAVAESVEAYRAADGFLTGRPPSAVISRVQSALATAAVRDGHHREGLRRAQRALAEAQSVRAKPEEGRALNSAGLALTMLGQSDEGVASLRAALRIATEADHLEDLLRAYANLGVCLEHAGMVTDAVEALQEGLEKARGHGVLHTRQGGVLANNASASLSLLGQWDEAVALLDEVLLNRPASETLYQRLSLAVIDVARGRFEEADRLLADVRRRPNTDPRFVGPLYCCLAELAVWRNDPRTAREAVAHGIEAVAPAENDLVLLQLCAVGLRVAADESVRRAGQPDDAAGQATRDWADQLMAIALEAGGNHQQSAEPEVLARQCDAEGRRLSHVDATHVWSEVAEGWAGLGRPYPRAYALMRESEAAAKAGAKGHASNAARAALAVTERLGARPLHEQITRLAARYRLKLAEPRVPEERPGGLTDRELEVLRAAERGLSTRQIAKELSISDATVSVHLSNVNKKLGSGGRTEAIARARRLGLFTE
ncbi:MAG TPA: AAA family ATPase [Micromonosporaceae bacterium]|nr:AAA family ATPase [Micromonosporaceae bacterium]